MQAEKGQIGTDFVYQNSCHKENCVNVCPFWDQTAPRKPLAYDLALSGIRPPPVPRRDLARLFQFGQTLPHGCDGSDANARGQRDLALGADSLDDQPPSVFGAFLRGPREGSLRVPPRGLEAGSVPIACEKLGGNVRGSYEMIRSRAVATIQNDQPSCAGAAPDLDGIEVHSLP